MCKFLLTAFLFVFISCSTSKEIMSVYNTNDISKLVALSETIKTEYSKTECGLKTFRIRNAKLRDSLSMQNISSISIKYSNDSINSNEYFYGNSIKLPDSCIIFSKDDYKTNDDQVTSTLLFYFFSKVRPTKFYFNTYKPITEKTKKVNDSVWVYKSVHQLVMIH